MLNWKRLVFLLSKILYMKCENYNNYHQPQLGPSIQYQFLVVILQTTADFFKNYVNIEFSYLLCTHLVIYYTFLFAVVAYSTYGVACDKDISLKISYSADFFRFSFV